MEAAIAKEQKVQIRQIGEDWAEQQGFFRFLRNKHIKEKALIRGVTNRLSEVVAGEHVLSIQDTSELHYHRHTNRIKDKGGLGDAGRSPLGYFIHPSLVVEAEQPYVLGLSDIHLWHRDKDRVDDTSSRKKRAIEQKESFKWLLAGIRSKLVLSKARQVTIIQDRDGDIYESFARIPDERTHLLVRSKTDRRIMGDHRWLYKKLTAQKISVVYELEINGDNKKRQKRKAHLALKYATVRIKRPVYLSKAYPDYIELTAVETREQASTVPPGEDPIHWRILTTHPVKDFMDAAWIIYWYSLRWLIEEFFRILKLKGFNLESSELGSGWALRKLGILTMQAATKVMQLRQAREKGCPLPIEVVFDQEQQACLKGLLSSLEGQTEKLKNPHAANSLSWASWIIARLGGWNGYLSQRPPGVITLSRGLNKFEAIFVGWKLARSSTLSSDDDDLIET